MFKAKLSKNIILAYTLLTLVGLITFTSQVFAQEHGDTGARIDTTNAGFVVKVAPGELLPIAVKLSNFGSEKRIDVLVKYAIFDNTGLQINEVDETIAVETTANFIKTIQVPFDTMPGTYYAKTSIQYGEQEVPGTSQFTFTVENKILGVFADDFTFYTIIALIVCALMIYLGHSLIRRNRVGRLTPIDYSNISKEKRTFFEILSDTILEMRESIGDDALFIAASIDGLKIDKDTGRVLDFTRKPSEIIDDLVAKYEKLLGKKAQFTFKRSKGKSK